jgi:FkbH-like protein
MSKDGRMTTASQTGTLAIAATFTAEPLLPSLRFLLETAGIPLDVRFAPYNQVFQELLSPTSLLAQNASGVNVVLVRIEDFLRDAKDVGAAGATLPRIVPELCAALTAHAALSKAPTIVSVFPPSGRSLEALGREIEAANATLLAHAASIPGLVILPSGEIELASTGDRYDDLSDELAHVPFTEGHYAAISLGLARKVHALRVPAHKVLVLDCDETLWQGVVGEDGVDGISIPADLAQLQAFAVEVQKKGVLVCLVSKNSEQDVLDVFAKRAEMILKSEHIVAHRINWEIKPRNIRTLAQALNLGLDSFVFIDDNPVECGLMRKELPQVVTLQLPPQNEIASFLSHLWTFDKLAVTDEDTRRTTMYRENAARQQSEESATDIAAFIASLGVVVDIDPPAEAEWPRLAQLTQRTSQFNFTTIRRSEAELRALQSDGDSILRVRVRDRFGDYGIVGLTIAAPADDRLVVDTFLLSCRVLGRGVEHTILRRLGEMAKAQGLSFVDLTSIATSRNEPARAFADSVAAKFRNEDGVRVVYRIPQDAALAMAHRPGHDPEAVIEARNSEERKGALPSAPSTADRSDRYARLARTLVSGASVLQALRTDKSDARRLPGDAAPATTDTERVLLQLWEEFLGISGLGVEDDYDALGGTSLIAARLFAEIGRRFGMRLPLTAILEFPTVRALAGHLDGIRDEGGPKLVALKRGGARNFFLVHDGDGETLLYVNLARRMPDDLAVFGIEPRHLRGIPLAHGSIEDMAGAYVQVVRERQPEGPYLLGGMCAGGVVAYEMAAQLERAGEEVALVAVLDAAAPRAARRRRRITEARLGRLRGAFGQSGDKGSIRRAGVIGAAIARKLSNALRWEIGHRLKRLSVRARFGLMRKVLERKVTWPRAAPELTVREIYDTAEAHYAPTPGSVASAVLFRARYGEGDDTAYRQIYADENLGWDDLARHFRAIDVEGGHSSMLQEPDVKSLAEALISLTSPKRETVMREHKNAASVA